MKIEAPELTQKLVKSLFDYKNGSLYWKVKVGNKNIGDKAGAVCVAGNQIISKVGFYGKTYYIHRIIFLWHNGYIPDNVDHIDRNRYNNSIENLREATQSQNNANKSIWRKQTYSRYLGVFFVKNKNSVKWYAASYKNGKNNKSTRRDSEQQAALDYNKLAVRLHGEFANLNIIKP